MVVLSGTALLLESELFLTSDECQADLAKAEGIKVALLQPTH
jgi:predicted PilT family ATPase